MTFIQPKEILEPAFGLLWGIVWEGPCKKCQIRFNSALIINNFGHLTVELASYENSLTMVQSKKTPHQHLSKKKLVQHRSQTKHQHHKGSKSSWARRLINDWIIFKGSFVMFHFLVLFKNKFCWRIYFLLIQNLLNGFECWFPNSVVNSPKLLGDR